MRKLGRILVFGAVVNLLSLIVAGAFIDGYGAGGRIENGEYLLVNRGRVTRVEPWIWQFSRGHTLSVFLTHALGLVGALILKTRAKDAARTRLGCRLSPRF